MCARKSTEVLLGGKRLLLKKQTDPITCEIVFFQFIWHFPNLKENEANNVYKKTQACLIAFKNAIFTASVLLQILFESMISFVL